MSKILVNRSKWLVVCLTLIPLWLALSAGVAVWWSLRDDDQQERERNQRFALEMSEQRISEDLRKLGEMVGERHTGEQSSSKNLTRAAAMVEGVLGPSNTGYLIERIVAPMEWPIIRVSLPAKQANAPHLWVLTPYDSPRDQSTALADSALAAAIAAAQTMAKDQAPCHIHFLFVPHGNEVEAPVRQTMERIQSLMKSPSAAFIIGPMGTSPQLLALSPNAASSSTQALGDLGSHQWLASNLENLATTYRSMGIPALWVTSRREGVDNNTIEASHIAITAGKLVEWLRRCARLEAAK